MKKIRPHPGKVLSPSFLPFCLILAKKAGFILKKYSEDGFHIYHKKQLSNNLVTEADRASEKYIVEQIRRKFPTHAIVGEEGGKQGAGKASHPLYRWIIDPLDGTLNFTHGFPAFAISIALEFQKEIILGVVYAPLLGEIFYAERGKGAFYVFHLSGKKAKKLTVSDVKRVRESLLATGLHSKDTSGNLPAFQHFLYKSQGIRRTGSAALDLCYVAAGRFDGFWEPGLSSWDIAAGSLIVEEAGGKVSNYNGKKLDLEAENIVASNGLIHKEICNHL